MRTIADLHIHSKHARACSPLLTLPNIAAWCLKKGIGIVGTGDFTHPGWFSDIENELEEDKPGLYRLRSANASPRFMLTAELASIYKQGEKVRRVHNLVFAPSIEVAKKFNQILTDRGINLKSDGRPIMGLHCDELVKVAKSVDSRMEIIPAHAWTPHFGVFGSLSGFDSLEEAYGDQAKYIFAIETGLSSDPKMNWEVSALDNISLISNSDPHSLHRLGREANVFDIPEAELSYDKIIQVIRSKDPKQFLSTVEFFPEEGKYHLDGHSSHKYSCTPEQTRQLGGICPVCGKKLLRGVMHRVSDLGDRAYGVTPPGATPFQNMIPLEEIIADSLGVGVGSKKVQGLYEQMVMHHSEFEILLDMKADDISKIGSSLISQSIERVRRGEVHIEAGYDGEYGKIHIYSSLEREKLSLKPKQNTLF